MNRGDSQLITLKDAIDFLNELVKIDADALRALIGHRVPCNNGLVDHPTVQVGEFGGVFQVGMLGILNGLFGVNEDGYGFITAVIDCDRGLVKFVKTKTQQEVGYAETD